MNRYNRLSWSTGFFVAIACIVAALGGIMMGLEGRKVKRVEGVPLKTYLVLDDAEAPQGSNLKIVDERDDLSAQTIKTEDIPKDPSLTG
ncbi:uncharacterized protein PV09_07366 [Verruconis gallopava]|uniref:Uncharacterized protein n=1 Tax=Verruconis gallopava TaxID=253628 RepID=A0A0D2A3R9_9PEZI|nr:uncharacterized protein PV09_07366 [Verruconis gallopava]KIW01075.1 hypothetical protein PV09_07366 [Verruconis gallopava]